MAERSEVVGASLGEPIVAALPKRLHGEDRERWCECWRAALSTGTPYEVEYRIPTADQPESWYELRNPLVPISTAAAVPGGNADTRVTAAREMIDRQLRQLTRLVEDLSDVSRIAHGNIELQRRAVDLAEAVRVAVDAARPLVSRRHHQLTLECPPQPVLVDADPVRLAQIFTNLLINAAKYTNPGGHISLVTAQHEREAAVCIRDDGIGIPADKMEEIFELFSQAALGASSGAQGSELGWQCRGSWWSCTEAQLPRSEGAGHGREFVVRLPVGSPN